MKFNLIIDGNYILNKNVFSLHKINEIYGNLETSLHNSLNIFCNWYPFTNVYLVSDSRGDSWRKNLYSKYKSTRKKTDSINWNSVFEIYESFKSELPKRVKLLEQKHIEGDDWISQLVCMGGESCTLIISNDHDLKQLIKFTTEPKTMVFMTNEMYNNGKLFLPNNYEIFLSRVRNDMSDNIFELTDETEFLNFMNKFIEKRDLILVDATKEYFIKLIKGDKSDNIDSAYTTMTSKGKYRGIGEAGANKIYQSYIKEFGDVNFNNDDNEIFDNISDLICEIKKISFTNAPKIKSNLELNKKLMNLTELPSEVRSLIKNKIKSL